MAFNSKCGKYVTQNLELNMTFTFPADGISAFFLKFA